MCHCVSCGINVFDAGTKGRYLTRVNEKGVTGIWECRPNCDYEGKPEEAMIGALESDGENRKNNTYQTIRKKL